MRRTHVLLFCAQSILWALLAACSGKTDGTGDTGGETHWQKGWLKGCVSTAGCPSGLTCIDNLCTLACSADAECEANGGGQCLDLGGQSACALPERLSCAADSVPCSEDDDGWLCVTGAASGCHLPIEVCDAGVWQPGTLDSCRDTITEAAPSAPATSEVHETQVGDAATAMDVLFVVDDSSSMADEQRGVARSIDAFLATLAEQIDARPRIAATTVDAQCDVDGTTVFASKGTFNTHLATAFPRTAQYQFRAECRSDADCEQSACGAIGACDDQTGLWACRTAISQQCIDNPNGTINTTCRRRCTTDDECRTALGDPGYSCQHASEDEADWGCLLPPDTDGCPDTLPPFVEGDDLGLARCLATTGVNQGHCFAFEEGLEASRLALDISGPNADQARSFLRPEAILVVIYVSDEDDCSAAGPITEDHYDTCAFLPTTDAGGPLVPTETYVDFLRSVKPSGRVIAMVMTGESLASDATDAQAEYDAYDASKTGPRDCNRQTYLCDGATGTADWGRRYIEVADAFGPDGHVVNLCGLDDGFDPKMRDLAASLAQNAKRVCLPRADLTGLVASIVRGGVETVLHKEDPGNGGYAIIDGAPECDSGRALAPNMRLLPGDTVRFAYP